MLLAQSGDRLHNFDSPLQNSWFDRTQLQGIQLSQEFANRNFGRGAEEGFGIVKMDVIYTISMRAFMQ